MKKQFKTESKKLMDLMINSIYTNKEIFLREIISNASDAIDKLHYMSLTDKSIKVNKKDFEIFLTINKENRTLTISDNGIGMDNDELENNLGTIAKSGSEEFKSDNEHKKNIDIIGQFGVGFYSAFMVAEKVEVLSRKYGSEEAYLWESTGVDGYTITKKEKEGYGTDIILTIKPDTEEEDYSKYLETYEIETLVRKYSDYITYPIKMEVSHTHLKEKKNENDEDEYETVTEVEVINSLTPIWRRDKKKVSEEDYDTFYSDKFNDYEKPLRHIHVKAEGTFEYNALLYIPSHAPYDFYTKDYEKGLQLYSNGVLIMEKCSDLLPDYFSFVKGVVDTEDVSLNISREMLQEDHSLKLIAKNIESKIRKELGEMLKNDRENYISFFKTFGVQLKYGIYNNFGQDKDKLVDLIMFYSAKKEKLITLKEYIDHMKEDQEKIYYASGASIAKVAALPQVEQVREKDYDILYLTDYVDEFAITAIQEYEGKKFANVESEDLDLESDEEKDAIKKVNEDNSDLLKEMKEELKEVSDVRFTNKLKTHPVCLTSKGDVSIEMQKVFDAMPNQMGIKAQMVLEINEGHPIADKVKKLYQEDKEQFLNYTKILYSEARMIAGLPIENPTEISNLICDVISK